MTTITNKKQYPSEQYLNELITNIEFAARAPVEVVRAMAAELQKRREADSAEPVAYIFKHPAGKLSWSLTDESNKEQPDVISVYAASPAPISSEAIEYAIEYIRSIAFHIDEDDYHGKHIAYFMRQALAWLEGHSCSDDRLGKADNQPASGNQAAESNRGNEWTGNPDIDNAIIMLDRIDTLENCDDDRIEAVKAVLRRLAGNYPVIPDSWISCSERMPNDAQWCVVDAEDGYYVQCWSEGQGWLGDDISLRNCDVIRWMPIPEPPQQDGE
ncbi:DUF551 domain-containing protein [Escherichia coli]|uniref:DUF551 domain-containing protein n=2 Tax=Escherichia coli TaxID=562 RepID=UPI002022015F|nr:DUF551 domain-containing protein [Escherichia coli]MCZ5428138.1 DUF551 domain-containing protein [Escherichia coli]MCZ5981670.1 DUF551 domain-containing protein [Escherichia coli]MCZ6030727.1 DUF551 domain-containing protein [Escherichia coli]